MGGWVPLYEIENCVLASAYDLRKFVELYLKLINVSQAAMLPHLRSIIGLRVLNHLNWHILFEIFHYSNSNEHED